MASRSGRCVLVTIPALGSFLLPCRADDGILLTIQRGSRIVAPLATTTLGNLVISHEQTLEQSLTVEVAGRLAGIEIAPLRDTAEPG